MLRILISGCAVFVLLFSMFLLPQAVSARRCPVKEPETLLSLYQASDAIYVAAFDRAADEAIVEHNEDYTAVEVAKHYTITSTLKGEPRKFLVLKDRDYRYSNSSDAGEMDDPDGEETDEPVEEELDELDEEQPELKSGDPVLLFIDLDDEEEGPTLTDYRDGIKRLSSHDIGVYETRIRELHSIFNAKKVDEMQIIEWLIKCAEDPATLWEGSYELLSSFESAEWAERYAEGLKERRARGEAVEEDDTDEADEPDSEGDPDAKRLIDTSVFAKLLNDQHKQRLANILFETKLEANQEVDGEKPGPARGERELIELVKRWGDTRLIPFLLDRLRAGSEDSWFTARTMEMVAELLDDKEAEAAAERYAEIVNEDDEVTVEEDADMEEIEAEDPDAPVVEDQETERPVDGDAEDPEANGSDTPSEDEAPVKKLTYKELRAELLQKFLDLCDRVLTERSGQGPVQN